MTAVLVFGSKIRTRDIMYFRLRNVTAIPGAQATTRRQCSGGTLELDVCPEASIIRYWPGLAPRKAEPTNVAFGRSPRIQRRKQRQEESQQNIPRSASHVQMSWRTRLSARTRRSCNVGNLEKYKGGYSVDASDDAPFLYGLLESLLESDNGC